MDDPFESIDKAAARWLIRSRADTFDAWDELADWLAQSPAHGSAFNALCAIDADVAAHLAAKHPVPANDSADDSGSKRWSSTQRWGWPTGGLVAATLVAALVFAPGQNGGQIYETKPGETMQVALDDGAHAMLNGGTRLEIQSDDRRTVAVARGEVTFSVVHGSGRPMRVTAGALQLRDLGTIFNVVHSASITQVAVSEGQVAVSGAPTALTIKRGEAVRFERGRTAPDIYTLPIDAVAGWQTGRLFFRDASFGEVADALSRRLGMPVSLAPALQNRRFTGVLGISERPEQAKAVIEPMLGVTITTTTQGWTVDAAPRI